MQIREQLLKVNAINTPIYYKLLDPEIPFSEFRERSKHFLIALSHLGGEPASLSVMPILKKGNTTLIHAGLLKIARNTGIDLMTAPFLSSLVLLYEKYGEYYLSNISSTPSIIEVVTKWVPNSWPSPIVNNKAPPRDYVPLLDFLYKEYLTDYWLNPDKIEIDKKRFVIRSTSKEMGYNTNFRELSRAVDFQFNAFCYVWVDYSKEEDIIQIGKVTPEIYRNCKENLRTVFEKMRNKVLAEGDRFK